MNTTKPNLTLQVVIAMLAGITVGLLLNISGLNSAGSFVDEYIVNGLFQVIGKLFINALKMLVVPLVLFSLICGVCGIGNLSTLGRVGIPPCCLPRLPVSGKGCKPARRPISVPKKPRRWWMFSPI